MTENLNYIKRIEALSLKTYGPRRSPVSKEFLTKDELIAMSPLGSSQPTDISRRYSKQRDALPDVLKKALKYLYPSKDYREKPPASKYDSLVRKMTNYSPQQNYHNPIHSSLSPVNQKSVKKINKQHNLIRKMSGLFDFPAKKSQDNRLLKKSPIKLPKIPEKNRYSSLDFISCINYTGEPESEYIKTLAGQKEYKQYYDLLLKDSGLYQEMRIRYQGN
jgi:hypothetical protein